MKRAISRLFLPALILTFLFAALPAQAMPLSEKASFNRNMPYYLIVDMTNQYVAAYRSDTDEPVRYMICSTGKISGTTPTGTFRLQSDAVYPWYAFESCYIRYGKRITGSIWFHSILYRSRSVSSLSWDSFYNLGAPASHGCIRLTPIDAQWISYNCKAGTSVRILRAPRTTETKALAAQLKATLRAAGHKGIQPTLTPTPRPTLSLGSNSARVKSLHARLRSLGFYPGAMTSVYSEETKAAVEAYQAATGLTVTGEADGALQNKIANDNSVTGRLTTLQYGDDYVAVKALQKKLRALGYLKSSFQLTTKFNAGTRTAVIAFQTISGLTIDGIASPAVQDQLFSAAAPTPTPSPAPIYAKTNQPTSLRKSKSTSSTKLKVIPFKKQVVVLTPSDGTWTQIRYDGKNGYALSKCLTVSP